MCLSVNACVCNGFQKIFTPLSLLVNWGIAKWCPFSPSSLTRALRAL